MKLQPLAPTLAPALAAALLTSVALPGHALEWSDNFLGFRTGSSYAEPRIQGESIHKDVYTFGHASGDALGRNLIVADVLKSDRSDPAAGGGGGATEFYGIYRRTLSLSRLTGIDMRFGPVKDTNLVGRIDMQTKNNAFAPRSRKLEAGISFDIDVPRGSLETGIYSFSETNHNGIVGSDVSFDTTYMVDVSWALPFNIGWSGAWKGSLSHIGAKGRDGFHIETKPETRLFTALMFDVGDRTGFAIGVGAEIWLNKYGNDHRIMAGANQKTALLLGEYHF